MEQKSKGVLKFFRNAFILLAVVIVFDQIDGGILHWMYFKQKTGPNAETTFTFTKMNADGIILGSSRGRRNYNPNILADSLGIKMYNAGHDGQTVFYEQAVIRTALARYSPKLVIIDLNPEEMYFRDLHYDRLNVLAPYYKDFPEIRDIYLLKGLHDRVGDPNCFFVKPQTEGTNAWNSFWNKHNAFEPFLLPFNNERVKMLSATYPNNSNILDILTGIFKNRKSEMGFKPLKGIITQQKADELIKENAVLRNEKGKKVDPNKLKALENEIELLQAHGSHIVISMSPALAPFGREPSYDSVEAVCRRYNIAFKDYSQDSVYLHLQYFFDNHLNKDGANMFSSSLASDIKREFFPQTFSK